MATVEQNSSYFDSMVKSQFQQAASPARIDEPAYELANGVSVRVNADVTPAGDGNTACANTAGLGLLWTTIRMISYFLPNAKWVPNQTEPGFQRRL